MESQIPKNDLDYYVPIGKAKVVSPGDSVTVLCYSSTVDLCTQAAQQLKADGVSVEVVDLRTISPNDIDYDTIGASLRKTNALVIVEQAPRSQSIGSKIAEHCQSRFFDYLDVPITTVTGLDIPNPVCRKLEALAVPTVDLVRDTLAKAAPTNLVGHNMIKSLGHVALGVSDMERSLAFYRDLLGMEAVMDLDIADDRIARVIGVPGATCRIVHLQLGKQYPRAIPVFQPHRYEPRSPVAAIRPRSHSHRLRG